MLSYVCVCIMYAYVCVGLFVFSVLFTLECMITNYNMYDAC